MIKKLLLLLTISILLLTGVTTFTAASDFPTGYPFNNQLTVPSGILLSELEQFIDEYAAQHIGTKTAGVRAFIVCCCR